MAAKVTPARRAEAEASGDDANSLHVDTQTPPADPVAAGLADLAGETAFNLAPPGEGVTDLDASERQAGAAPAVDLVAANVTVILASVGVLRETLVHMARLKSPAETLSDTTIAPAADAIAKVLAKHQVNLQLLTKGYELEISAAFITWPIAAAAYAGVRAEIDERKGSKPAVEVKKADALTSTPIAPPAAAAPGAIVFPPGDPRSVSLNGSA